MSIKQSENQILDSIIYWEVAKSQSVLRSLLKKKKDEYVN